MKRPLSRKGKGLVIFHEGEDWQGKGGLQDWKKGETFQFSEEGR